MRFLNKMERKFGKYAVRDLTKVIVIVYVIGLTLQIVMPQFVLQYLLLDPEMVFEHGQVWRLFSWVLVCFDRVDFFTVFAILCMYSVSKAMERTLGDFYYNLYIFGGLFLTGLATCLMYPVVSHMSGLTGVVEQMTLPLACTSGYVALSVMLAFSITYPDAEFLLFFIIPIKAKWLGLLYGAMMAYSFIKTDSWVSRIIMLVSILNFFLYYLTTKGIRPMPKAVRQQRDHYRKVMEKQKRANQSHTFGRNQQKSSGKNQGTARKPQPGLAKINPGGARHCCAICGRTELTNPELEFRFCSKCEGSCEYCQDHLFTHIHVKNGSKPSLTPEGQRAEAK